ncbi:hypothetical protein NQ315_013383 [Exocentrus adspersus]|uniref:Uncharacterized protein n=1 Tax=Exocentrus adspersus TaxID=1586481 RepID=A0AAV8VRM5_9CUCU|nr:hypothetical protein NQ315_013383 [Exocentrus adspersus]
MVGYGDRIKSHDEACALFNREHPERARSTVNRLVSKYLETETVKDVKRVGRPEISEETKLNVLLEFQENPHCSTRQLGRNNNIDNSTVVKLFKREKFHPYKMAPVCPIPCLKTIAGDVFGDGSGVTCLLGDYRYNIILTVLQNVIANAKKK